MQQEFEVPFIARRQQLTEVGLHRGKPWTSPGATGGCVGARGLSTQEWYGTRYSSVEVPLLVRRKPRSTTRLHREKPQSFLRSIIEANSFVQDGPLFRNGIGRFTPLMSVNATRG